MSDVKGLALAKRLLGDVASSFTVDEFGFYLEDQLLITSDGYELLTPGYGSTSSVTD